jgi:hypothetical protein
MQIRWPSGRKKSFDNLSTNSIQTLKEGSGTPVTSETKRPHLNPQPLAVV